MSDWVIRLIEQAGVLGVGFLMFLETVFPPIPSEVIMPVAGVAAAQGKMSLWAVIASGTAGAMLGNLVWYLAARALGIIRLKPFILRWGRWFGTRGWLIVGVGRLLPTLRSIISVPAGLLKMRFSTFFVASTIGTALWTALLTGAGYTLGKRYHDVDRIIGPASNLIMAALVLGYVWRLWRQRARTQISTGSDQ